jgi:hypothetical protein
LLDPDPGVKIPVEFRRFFIIFVKMPFENVNPTKKVLKTTGINLREKKTTIAT